MFLLRSPEVAEFFGLEWVPTFRNISVGQFYRHVFVGLIVLVNFLITNSIIIAMLIVVVKVSSLNC